MTLLRHEECEGERGDIEREGYQPFTSSQGPFSVAAVALHRLRHSKQQMLLLLISVDVVRLGFRVSFFIRGLGPSIMETPTCFILLFFYLLGPFKWAWAIKSKPVLNPCCLAALLNKAYLKALHFANGA